MVTSILKNTFVGGEWSPSLYERTDLQKYYTACKTMKNFMIQPQGGAIKRGGTRFIAEVKDSTTDVRLIPFQFSVTQSYMLEFGDEYMRVFSDKGQVLLDSTPAAYNSETTYDTGDHVSYSGVNYYSRVDSNIGNQPDISTTEWYALEGEIVEIPTPYTEDMLSILKFTQSADILYLTHPSIAPQQLLRFDNDEWQIEAISFGGTIDPPTALTMTGSSNTYTVTAISEDDGSESEIASSTTGDPGNTLTWTVSTGALYYKVYEIVNDIPFYLGLAQNDSYVIASGAEPDLNKTAPSAETIFNSTDNYPGSCAFYQQRLLFARTNNKPQTFWGSQTGSYTNFNKSIISQDDDSYEFTIASGEVNEIKALTPLTDLIIGTTGAEWKANSGTTSSIATNNITLNPQSRYGSDDLKPLIIGNNVMFIENSNDLVRNFLFLDDRQAYQGSDLNILAKHLVENYNIVSWGYQKEPYKTIWCVRDDGALLGLSYDLENQITAWHQHDTDGKFLDVESIVNINGDTDVYLVIERIIGGTFKKYVEILENPLNTDDVRDSFYVDSGLSLDVPISITNATQADPVVITATGHGLIDDDLVDISDIIGMTELNGLQFKVDNATTNTFSLKNINDDQDIDGTGYGAYIESGDARKAVSSISGLTHLEGKEVSVLANGNIVVGKIVASGAITLPNAASRISVGLQYTADLTPLDFVVEVKSGSIQEKLKQIKSVVIELQNTREVFIGANKDLLLEVKFRTNEPYLTPIELFDGSKEINLLDNINRNISILMRSINPLPITVLSVTGRLNIGKR